MTAIDIPARKTASRRRPGAAAPVETAMGNGVTGGHKLPTAAVLYMVMMMMPFTMSAGGIALSPVRVILLFLVLPLTANLLSGKYGRLRVPDILLFAYVLWQGVSIGYWHGTQAIQFVGSTGIEAIGGYLVGRAYIRSKEDYEALARVFGLFVLATVPFAMIEAIFGQRIIVELFGKLPVIDAYNASTAERRLGMDRAQVNFTHTIHYGIFAALGFSMSFLVVKPLVTPAWGWTRSALIGAGSFFSLSSGGFLVFVMQAGLIGWRWMARDTGRPWVVFLSLFAVFYLIVEVLSDRSAFMVLLTMAAFSEHNAYWRTILFDYAMQNLGDSPLVGVGLNDWYRPSWITHPSLDNFWAYVALVYGVPAFVFLSSATLLPVFRAMRIQIPDSAQRLMRCRAAWVLTMVALIFALCTVHVWGKIYSLFFFVLGSGVWLYDAADGLAPAETGAPRGAKAAAPREGARMDPLAEDGTANEDGETDAPPRPGARYTRFPAGAAPDRPVR